MARGSAGKRPAAGKQSDEQQRIVERVMHEFKEGELAARGGRQVSSRKQAIAIALREAGASDQESPAGNRRNLARTRRRERAGERSRDELYAEARRRGIKGRSRMSKAELARALSA
ncbi:MAG: DUF6496 domain-containing protein [Geminicoccaceae bacterium]